MSKNVPSQPKERLNRTVVAKSKWATFYKDRVLSNGGYELEYWCVDRSDSVIILVRQDGKFLMPEKQYRLGINERTLDFPGGRVDENEVAAAAEQTVLREFQLDGMTKPRLEPLNSGPLFVDSAYSSQKLYGFVAELPKDVHVQADRYTADELLTKLQCLQCRALLLEWLHRN